MAASATHTHLECPDRAHRCPSCMNRHSAKITNFRRQRSLGAGGRSRMRDRGNANTGFSGECEKAVLGMEVLAWLRERSLGTICEVGGN